MNLYMKYYVLKLDEHISKSSLICALTMTSSDIITGAELAEMVLNAIVNGNHGGA